MEEKLVRCWAEDQSCKAPVDEGHGFRSACEPMDKHRTMVESIYSIEVENLLQRFLHPLLPRHAE